MDSTQRTDRLYSPVPGVIPGEIDVTRPPVARRDEEGDAARIDAPRRPAPSRVPPADNPQHLSPWRSRIAAAALLTVAIVAVSVAFFVL